MEATFVYATGVLVLAPTKRIVRRAYTHRVGIDTNRVSMSALAICNS
jgi:histone H3/H4